MNFMMDFRESECSLHTGKVVPKDTERIRKDCVKNDVLHREIGPIEIGMMI